MNKVISKILSQPIDNQEVISLVESESAGAVAVFIGTVRNQNLAKKVVRLEYEAYEAMAVKKMNEIAEAAHLRWHTEKIAIYHRVGSLAIGEVAVVVAVSTKHRRESFEACQYIIDTLKEVVPIWKKEIYEDGQVWLAAHP
ncbi:MAG: molybdenum cofactor biosynthesis protein MoaE [Microscillaceae bacterium]|jgi:molybdopterin synthase catalytic subunit|nr:molybdenum cofactor biosynthesis protein MoaE [Microscillaceae bacterium]